MSVVFNPGVFTQMVTLTTLSDTPIEGDQYLFAVLSTTDSRVNLSPAVANVTITEEGMSHVHIM